MIKYKSLFLVFGNQQNQINRAEQMPKGSYNLNQK
jgi:hypothetical protein